MRLITKHLIIISSTQRSRVLQFIDFPRCSVCEGLCFDLVRRYKERERFYGISEQKVAPRLLLIAPGALPCLFQLGVWLKRMELCELPRSKLMSTNSNATAPAPSCSSGFCSRARQIMIKKTKQNTKIRAVSLKALAAFAAVKQSDRNDDCVVVFHVHTQSY